MDISECDILYYIQIRCLILSKMIHRSILNKQITFDQINLNLVCKEMVKRKFGKSDLCKWIAITMAVVSRPR